LNDLATLAATPARIAELIEGVSDAATRVRGKNDIFAIVEQVCHLRDIEREGHSVRIERLLQEDNPFLEDIDGARLARERRYLEQDLQQALESFTTARRNSLTLLATANDTALARSGTFENVGPVTLERLVGMMREHDQGHIAEIAELAGKGMGIED
jgi:DinB superfamily